MTSLPDYDDSLRRRVRVALLHEWDPIGIRQYLEAHDEYDSYVPDVCNLLQSGATSQELFSFLWSLETEHMGLQGNRNATEQFANRLIQLRDEASR